MPHLLSTN